MRVITGRPDADRKELLKETFNPTTGTLHDRDAWQAERVGIYNFIEGAFLTFRNPPAHRFVETDGEEAFDLIVLANRILLLIEARHQSLGVVPKSGQPSQSTSHALLSFLRSKYTPTESDDIWILDTNNDGSDEIVTPNYVDEGLVIDIVHSAEGDVFGVVTEQVEHTFSATDVLLADVDNDGQQEVVCVAFASHHSLTMFYKYQNGRYEVLKKDPSKTSTEGSDTPWFINARVVDIDEDGQMEVVSEPKESGYLPAPARYVWKWDEEESFFELLYLEPLGKKVVHVVPRGNKWAVMREGDEKPASLHDSQREAEQKGRETARKDMTDFYLHNRKGQIRERDSYGSDPYPPKD